MYSKSHVSFVGYTKFCCHPKVFAAVECLIGRDILLANSLFLPNEAHSKPWVSWHQDAKCRGLAPREAIPMRGVGFH